MMGIIKNFFEKTSLRCFCTCPSFTLNYFFYEESISKTSRKHRGARNSCNSKMGNLQPGVSTLLSKFYQRLAYYDTFVLFRQCAAIGSISCIRGISQIGETFRRDIFWNSSVLIPSVYVKI